MMRWPSWPGSRTVAAASKPFVAVSLPILPRRRRRRRRGRMPRERAAAGTPAVWQVRKVVPDHGRATMAEKPAMQRPPGAGEVGARPADDAVAAAHAACAGEAAPRGGATGPRAALPPRAPPIVPCGRARTVCVARRGPGGDGTVGWHRPGCDARHRGRRSSGHRQARRGDPDRVSAPFGRSRRSARRGSRPRRGRWYDRPPGPRRRTFGGGGRAPR